ncbi:MAG: hypothetical protein KDK71_09820, partial [Chlamydiia bacterium]|nr:hypothetical protein [Chlamydiia bacterium]
PAEDLTKALSLIQELNKELATTNFDRVTFANFKEYIEALQAGNVLVDGSVIDPKEHFKQKDKTTYSSEEARQVLIVPNLQQAIKRRVKDESQKGVAELSATATKAISFWKTAMINAGKELDDDHSSSLMHAAIEEVTGKYQQEHTLENNDPELTEMKTFLEGEAKQIWAKESTEKYIKGLAEELDLISSHFKEQYQSILKKWPQGNPLARDLMIEELEELLQTINLTLQKMNSELITQAELYGPSLGEDVFIYQTEMIQKLNQQKTFTEALAKMNKTLTAIETKLKTLSPNSEALLGQIVTNHAVVRGAAKKSNPDFKGEANVARVFKANNNLDANVKAFNALEVVDGTLPARDVSERAHFYSAALNEAQEQIDTLFEGNQEATSAHRSAQNQAALSRETLNQFKVNNQPTISDEPLQSPPITEKLALPLLEHIDTLLGDRYENASPTLLRQLLIAIKNEENGLENVFGKGALLIQISLTDTSIDSLFTEGEKHGTKETFAQLYTISEESYNAIKEAVRSRKIELGLLEDDTEELEEIERLKSSMQITSSHDNIGAPNLRETVLSENPDLAYLQENIDNPKLIYDKLKEINEQNTMTEVFGENWIQSLGALEDLFFASGSTCTFSQEGQKKLKNAIETSLEEKEELEEIERLKESMQYRPPVVTDDPSLQLDG